MKKPEVRIGDRVTCKRPVWADYSSYAGNPRCQFVPLDIGTVRTVEAPYVRRACTFVLVEFYKQGIPYGKDGRSPWRAGLDYDNIVVLGEKHEH